MGNSVLDTMEHHQAHHVANVLDTLPTAIYAVDAEWRGTVVNAAAAQHLGRPPEALLRALMWEALPQVPDSPIFQALKTVMSERKPAVLQLPSSVRPGRIVEIHVSPTRDGGLACAFTDITARWTAENRLRESEAFLRLVLDSAASGIIIVDSSGLTTMINRAGLALFGRQDAEEAVGRKLHELIYGEHANRPGGPAEGCPILRCALEGISAHVTDAVINRADGRPVPVEYWAEPIAGNGQRNGAICVFADATERKRAEEAERRLKEDLERLVAERTAERDRVWQLSNDMMSVSSHDGRVLAINPAVTRILGWSPEELLGTLGRDLLHPDDLASAAEQAKRLQSGERIFRYQCRLRCKDGSYRFMDFTATSEEGRNYAVGRDITAERESAEALRKSEEALRQAQKMEAVGQLTGGIAHDFNNMLSIIIGNLDLARRRLARGDTGAERYLANAREGADRASVLTHRLLAFSRQQPLAPRVVNIDRLVRDVSELIQRTLGETVDLEMVNGVGLWVVHVDPNQLESALLNVALNARDAMPDGGKLTIETSNSYIDDAYAAREIGVQPGQYVLVAISDTGAGMTPDVIAKAFDPFFTTKPAGRGTGLGLSMVYGFVKQSGGHVKIYSEVGRGTTVKLYLPRHFGELDSTARSVEPQEVRPGATPGETILVVEDDERVRQVTTEALCELGYTVFEASGGEEAIALAERLEQVDLLFTDVVMPKMSGRQLAEQLSRRLPRLKVLYTTGYTRNAIVHNNILEPGVEFLPKPFSVSDLALKVRAVLDAQG